ncbi:hypothetical protein [Halobacillus faecis]|uniref:Uncharacterized protein n=1 Tax=Halobacillus faecis TaxID=360184 RepID=A0A511WNK5_9BACI|nr:hypothetical protein [Halobacillus faecis]GEN52730.1 hypothetical protein HFA01_09920 [Halobacillus faecis]
MEWELLGGVKLLDHPVGRGFYPSEVVEEIIPLPEVIITNNRYS